jgi:hypothetical protein
LNLEDLAPDERDILTARTHFNPATHDVYRFSVIPEFLMTSETHGLFGFWPRKAKKASFSAADNVTIQARVGSPEIQLYGIHPVTMTVDGQPAFEYEGRLGVDAGVPYVGKVNLGGTVKNILKKRIYSVFAGSTDELAQWVFLKGWLDAHSAFQLQILCSVPKSLNVGARYFLCDVRVAEGNREIKKAIKRKVLLPTPSVAAPAPQIGCCVTDWDL